MSASIYESLKQTINKSYGKTIKDCFENLSPVIEKALRDEPKVALLNLEIGNQKVSSYSKGLINTLNHHTFIFGLESVAESPSITFLRGLVQKHPDAHYIILLCVFSLIEEKNRSTDASSYGKETSSSENRSIAMLINAALIFYGSSKCEFLQEKFLTKSHLLFKCIEHRHCSELTGSSSDIVNRCQFSRLADNGKSSAPAFIAKCIDRFQCEEKFVQHAPVLIEKFWLSVLSRLERHTNSEIDNSSGSEVRCNLKSVAQLTLLSLLKDAERFIFPFCAEPSSFTDVFIRCFESAENALHGQSEPVFNEYISSLINPSNSRLSPLCATATSAFCLKGVYTLIVEHRIEYRAFFTYLLALINPWLLDLNCFEEVFSIISSFLSGPMVQDQIVKSFLFKISHLCISHGSGKNLVLMIDLVKQLLQLHPSLQSLIKTSVLVTYGDVSMETSGPEPGHGEQSNPESKFLHNIVLLAQHPLKDVRRIARGLLFRTESVRLDGGNPLSNPLQRQFLSNARNPAENKSLEEIWSI